MFSEMEEFKLLNVKLARCSWSDGVVEAVFLHCLAPKQTPKLNLKMQAQCRVVCMSKAISEIQLYHSGNAVDLNQSRNYRPAAGSRNPPGQ